MWRVRQTCAAVTFEAQQQLRQLGDVRRNPPRLCRMYAGRGHKQVSSLKQLKLSSITFPLPRPQHAELPWSFERCRRENLL